MRLPTYVSFMSAALALTAACSRSSEADRADPPTERTEVTISRGSSRNGADTLRAGDVRITTVDGSIDLALLGDSISSGLSQGSLDKVRTETDTAAVDGTGLAANLERMVKGTVQSAVGTRISVPISAIRDVRYENGAIVIDWVGERRTIFDNTKINGKRLLESFRPDDARRFVDAVKARKVRSGEF
jgi:hypothetical protein